MLHRRRPRSLSRTATASLVALSLVSITGCGAGDEENTAAGPISAATLCSDFMTKTPAERIEGTARVATEIGVPNPSGPEWVETLEGRCADAPYLILRDFFNHFM